MRNKKLDIFIIASTIFVAIFMIISIQKKETYTRHYLKEQLQIFKTPIPFMHKIQYFYDKAILFYQNNEKNKAIENLEISKSFISPFENKEMKEIKLIIDKTIKNIKNNKNFNYLKYENELYRNLTYIMHKYYENSHNLISTFNTYIQKNDSINKMLQISIFLFAVLTILSYILYSLKERFKISAFIDPLTEALNRRSFFEEIKFLPQNYHCLVMADIDQFKKINDTYGHDMGDFVLKEFVKIIKENIRKEDKIFRWGGEEFIILFKNMKSSQAKTKIENIKKIIENHNFKGIKITSSFGIIEIKGKPTNEDFKILDNALYISKERGRNRITVF